MVYDEKKFKKIANQMAMTVWGLMAVVISVVFVLGFIGKQVGLIPMAIGVALSIVPALVGLVVGLITRWHKTAFRVIMLVGYTIMYAFALFTLKSPLAFAFGLPFAAVLVLYKSRALIIVTGVLNVILVAAHIAFAFVTGAGASFDIMTIATQIGLVLLCYIGSVLAVIYLKIQQNALSDVAADDLSKVVGTMDQVKGASNMIVDGVSVVRELAEENKYGSSVVVNSMRELKESADNLQTQTRSSYQMTQDIEEQISNVSALVKQMTEMLGETSDKANGSSDELTVVAESTYTMAELSEKIEVILANFKKQFAQVKAETGTIKSITSKTNLLALNASIEAARAGEAGKGFAVVADQIRELSMGTQSSSDSIIESLNTLEETSQHMTDAISEIISLIVDAKDKVESASNSMADIKSHAKELEDSINVVDSAMNDVSTANSHLVENMSYIEQVMDTVKDNLVDADLTTKTMMSKYESTVDSVSEIENVVGKLVEHLGASGFMGIEDIKPEMIVTMVPFNGKAKEGIAISQIYSIVEDTIFIDGFFGNNKIEDKIIPDQTYEIRVIVENSVYVWKNISLEREIYDGRICFKAAITTDPQVLNRRKFPRVTLDNPCSVTVRNTGKTYICQMYNLSANGFAFVSEDRVFEDCKGKMINVEIPELPLLNGVTLTGCVIRATHDSQKYVVGCRMPSDNMEIKAYVEQHQDF